MAPPDPRLSRARTGAERSRAARLRARQRGGRSLSPSERRWLDAYEAAVGASRRARARPRPPGWGARRLARAAAEQIADWLEPEGGPHAGIAHYPRWPRRDTAIGDVDDLEADLPTDPTGLSVTAPADPSAWALACRVLLRVDGVPQWLSVLALTTRWERLSIVLAATLVSIEEKYPSAVGDEVYIEAVSTFVIRSSRLRRRR